MSAHALPEVSVQIAGLWLQYCPALSKAATLQRSMNKRDSASKKHHHQHHHHQSANTGLQDCWRGQPPFMHSHSQSHQVFDTAQCRRKHLMQGIILTCAGQYTMAA